MQSMFKSPSVALLPYQPTRKNDQGVETFPVRLSNPFVSRSPPISRKCSQAKERDWTNQAWGKPYTISLLRKHKWSASDGWFRIPHCKGRRNHHLVDCVSCDGALSSIDHGGPAKWKICTWGVHGFCRGTLHLLQHADPWRKNGKPRLWWSVDLQSTSNRLCQDHDLAEWAVFDPKRADIRWALAPSELLKCL